MNEADSKNREGVADETKEAEAGRPCKLEIGRLTAEPPAWAWADQGAIAALASRPGRLRLALTGGVASGKSRVAALLESWGAKSIDMDQLARLSVAPGEPGFAAALELLGPDFLGPEGELDRARVGRAVFSDALLRQRLEEIIHPLVWGLMGRELEAMAQERAVIVSVPLLFETGLNTLFRPVVMVFASPAVQVERLIRRQPQLTRAEAEEVLAAQWPSAPKVRGSDFVINNNGGWAETEAQVRAVWERLEAFDFK